MGSSTRTRYAKSGDVDIAYQVLGEGPIDLLLYTGAGIPIDCVDDEPSMARFQRRLSSFGRLLRFDTRGTGLSERGSPSTPPTQQQWVEDGLAVLDAIESEQAVVLAPWAYSPVGLVLASEHPERVSRLIVLNGRARTLWATDYPIGVRQPAVDQHVLNVSDPNAVEQGVDVLSFIAPSVANDTAFRSWFDRSGNLGRTPAMAQALLRTTFEADVRDQLPLIRVPTLVIQRSDSILAEFGRYLGEHIPGVKYVELPGTDVVYWVGDTGRMLDEIEEFVTGVRGGSGIERVLATVLFTDIVDSTDRAAQMGDEQWRDLLDRHDQSVRAQIKRFGGREVDNTGDGFLATFDSPGRAIECALAIRVALKALDLDIRAGIHTGEIEVRGDDIAGIAVHIGARVSALAGPGVVLVSGTVPPLLAGSDFQFADRGEHNLKGVPGSWRLYEVDV